MSNFFFVFFECFPLSIIEIPEFLTLCPQVIWLGPGEQSQDLRGPECLGHGSLDDSCDSLYDSLVTAYLDGELHGGHGVHQAQVPAVELHQTLAEFLQLKARSQSLFINDQTPCSMVSAFISRYSSSSRSFLLSSKS